MIINTLDKLKLYPVTIIGTGPASLTLALELEEKKISCLILEAGSFERTEDSQDFYKGYSGGENSYSAPGEVIWISKGVVGRGGTVCIWYSIPKEATKKKLESEKGKLLGLPDLWGKSAEGVKRVSGQKIIEKAFDYFGKD